MYIRKYGIGFDLSWQKTFNTQSKKKLKNIVEKKKLNLVGLKQIILLRGKFTDFRFTISF